MSLATYMRKKKILQLYVEKRLSSCLSYRLFVTFLTENQRLSLAKKNIFSPTVDVVTVSKKITAMVSPPDRDFSELSPRKQPPSWVRESDSVCCLLMAIMPCNREKTCLCHVPQCIAGQDLNHNTLELHPCDYTYKQHTGGNRVNTKDIILNR